MPHQADLTDSCKIRPAPREDGAGAPGGASQGRSPARGAPDAAPQGAALIQYGLIRQRSA
jgi:hypothetical protein